MTRYRHSPRFLEIVTGLLKLHKAGKLPALYVDSDVIRIPWPAEQIIPDRFRQISTAQAERLIAGEPLDSVLHYRHPPKRQHAKRKPAQDLRWIARRSIYLARKTA